MDLPHMGFRKQDFHFFLIILRYHTCFVWRFLLYSTPQVEVLFIKFKCWKYLYKLYIHQQDYKPNIKCGYKSPCWDKMFTMKYVSTIWELEHGTWTKTMKIIKPTENKIVFKVTKLGHAPLQLQMKTCGYQKLSFVKTHTVVVISMMMFLLPPPYRVLWG